MTATLRKNTPWLIVSLLIFGLPLAAEDETDVPEPVPVAIGSWLVLGPVPDPLPVFGDERPGGFRIGESLAADRLPVRLAPPVEGGKVIGFSGGALTWSARDAGDDGRLPLEVDSGDHPATAWLAAYVDTDRWRKVKLELPGSHPRRVLLDGQEIASGTDAATAEAPGVGGELELLPGKHLLLVQTVFDPASDEEHWTVGGRLMLDADAPGDPPTVEVDPRRDVNVLDVLDGPRITSLAVSPNGRAIALTVSEVLPGTDDSESRLELRSPSGGSLGIWRGFGMRQVAWSPNSSLSYITGDAESTSSLWVMNAQTREMEQILDRVPRFGSYRWTGDGKAVVYSTLSEVEPDPRGVKRLENLHDRQAGDRNKSQLNLVSVPGGIQRRLTAGAASATLSDVSADGKRILFTRQVEDLERRPYTRTQLWEMELEGFEATMLREFRWWLQAQYAGDHGLLIRSGPSTFDGAGRAIAGEAIANEYDQQLYLWDPTADRVAAITREFDPSVRSTRYDPQNDAIYLTAEDGDRVRLFRYDIAAESLVAIQTPADSIRNLDLANGAPVGAATGSGPWMPSRLLGFDLSGGDARIIMDIAADRFTNVRSGTVEPFTFEAASGRTIDGRVYLPPDLDRKKKHPAIVYYYGGTSPVGREFGGRYPKEYWAALGYVVYVLQPSGATGYGQEFSALHVNDWGKTSSAEIIEGVKKFLQAHPFVDPDRVGCIGASYGGFMTMTLVTQTELFSAAVSHAGISSIASYWGEGYWGFLYSAVATAESFPWNRGDIYRDRSPLAHADKVTTPILLTHGAADTNVPVGESDAFYTALKLVGAPVEYVQVDGQDHHILDHAKRAVWTRTIAAWFDRWLKDQPEWWESLYPERE